MNAIVPVQEQAIESVKVLANIVHALYSDVMRPGMDYGVIPNTGTKPVLLLPGMEKLMRALRLRPEYVERRVITDFERPLFFYEYEARLYEIDSGLLVSSAIGSANSHETKWRWRERGRVCPACGATAIIKGKEEYGGGWICYGKKGGCGAKYKDGDAAIEAQETGRVENPDIADQLNTICKIAQKRALASAIKGAANVSELFTVDLEDLNDYVIEQTTPAPAVPNPADAPPATPNALQKKKPDGPLGRPATPAEVRVDRDEPPSSASEADVLLAEADLADFQEYEIREVLASPVKSKGQPTGAWQYVMKTAQGVNIALYGGDHFRAVGIEPDTFKASPNKAVRLETPLVVWARLVDGKWDIGRMQRPAVEIIGA